MMPSSHSLVLGQHTTGCNHSFLAHLFSPPRFYPAADLRTEVSGAPPHQNRTQFFRFYTHFHQKVPASEVDAPPTRVSADPTGNTGSSPVYFTYFMDSIRAACKIQIKNSLVELYPACLQYLPLPVVSTPSHYIE